MVEVVCSGVGGDITSFIQNAIVALIGILVYEQIADNDRVVSKVVAQVLHCQLNDVVVDSRIRTSTLPQPSLTSTLPQASLTSTVLQPSLTSILPLPSLTPHYLNHHSQH